MAFSLSLPIVHQRVLCKSAFTGSLSPFTLRPLSLCQVQIQSPSPTRSPAQPSHPGGALCLVGLPATQSWPNRWSSGETLGCCLHRGPGDLVPTISSAPLRSLSCQAATGPHFHSYRLGVSPHEHASLLPTPVSVGSGGEAHPPQEGTMGPGARMAPQPPGTPPHPADPGGAGALRIFFFCWLKLSMMTPMKRFRVKKDPKMMKMTK